MGKVLIAAFAVQKVVDFALGVGKAEQALSRLSAETQINTDDLQDLTAATADYGLSNEELAKALYNVSKGISGGDDSVARGLHQIGLSLDEVKNLHGKELFLTIEDGLAQLQGSLRDTAAADIFGSKLGASMAGFAKEARSATDAAGEFNAKLSPAEIANLKNYADQVDRLEKNFGTLKDKALNTIASQINSITDAYKGGVPIWKLAAASLQDTFSVFQGKGITNNLKALLDESNAKLKEQKDLEDAAKNASVGQTQEISKQAQAFQFLSALRLDSAKALEPYQKQGLEDLRSMGQLNQQNAAAIGVGADQFKKYTEEVRQAETATKALADATLAQNAQLEKIAAQAADVFTKQHGTQTEIELADIQARENAEIQSAQRRADALKISLAAQHADSKEVLAQIDADTASTTKKIEGYYGDMKDNVGVDFDEIRAHSQASLDDAAARALKTLIEARSQVGTSRAELDKLTDNYRRAAEAATAMGQQSAEGSKESTAAIQDTNKALIDQYNLSEKVRLSAAAAFKVSQNVTAANFDTAFSTPAGLSRDSIIGLLKQGFSLENAIEVLQAQKRGVALDLSKWPEDARGPRVPGFKYGVDDFAGGTAIVGEDGPELVKLPRGASVLPLKGGGASRSVSAEALAARPQGGSQGAGTSIYSPVYVSGVFDPSSAHALGSTVSRALLDGVSNGRVLR